MRRRFKKPAYYTEEISSSGKNFENSMGTDVPVGTPITTTTLGDDMEAQDKLPPQIREAINNCLFIKMSSESALKVYTNRKKQFINIPDEDIIQSVIALIQVYDRRAK